MAKVAVIGLGNMGGPMAGNLVKQGHEVVGVDLVKANLEAAAKRGVTAAASAADAVRGAACVITMLPAGKDTIAVYENLRHPGGCCQGHRVRRLLARSMLPVRARHTSSPPRAACSRSTVPSPAASAARRRRR